MSTGREQTTQAKGYSGYGNPNTLPIQSPSQGGASGGADPMPDSSASEDNDPWAGLFEEDSRPRRRWPAVIAFSVVGLAVALIGIAVAGRLRQKYAVTQDPSASTVEPRQKQSTTAPTESKDAVVKTEAVIEAKKPQLSPADESQPTIPEVQAAAASPIPSQTANQAKESVPSVQLSNPAVSKNQNTLASASDKPMHTALSAAPRRSAPHKVTIYPDKSERNSQAEAEHGVPVDQTYINGRGELVDARGTPLRSETAQPDSVPSAGSAAK